MKVWMLVMLASLATVMADFDANKSQANTFYRPSDMYNKTTGIWDDCSFSCQKAHQPKVNLNQFLSAIPTMADSVPLRSSNELCAKHSKFVLQSAYQMEVWSLKLFDASGKFATGLLRGNVNQLGDFDQCMSVNGYQRNETTGDEEQIKGKYCLASIDITLPPYLKSIDSLLHSHYVIRSKLTDPGHRIPKFSSMYWALCVPDSCSHDDVKELVTTQIGKLELPDVKKEVSVEEHMCQTKPKNLNLTYGTILTAIGFAFIIILTMIATIANEEDVKKAYAQATDSMKRFWFLLLESFSLKKNVTALLSFSGPADDVACLHGIRALNAIALLLSHKCMQLLFYSYVNRTEMAEIISYPYSMLARSAIVYTDSFILISGCLAAQCFLKNLDKNKNEILKNYVNRFLRLTPNLLAIILFCTFILPVLNSGPLWNVVVSSHAELCKRNWWRNILYVHNYFGFEEMCLTHTHQLGIDMQLYFTSPLLVYILWRFPVLGVSVSAMLATVSTYLRYHLTLQHNLSPIIYYGVNVSQLFNTASLSYILPTHRATVYIMGIILGYVLHYRSSFPLRLNKTQIQVGTFFFSSLGFIAMFGTYWMSSRHYQYSPKEAAIYMAFSPIIWCAALIWGILINVYGYTGQIGEFFKWPGFRVFTRIAYALYLIQFPVFFYNVGSTKTPIYFTTKVLLNIEEYTIIFALSILVTLLFDLPFQNISRRIKFSWNSLDITNNNKIK